MVKGLQGSPHNPSGRSQEKCSTQRDSNLGSNGRNALLSHTLTNWATPLGLPPSSHSFRLLLLYSSPLFSSGPSLQNYDLDFCSSGTRIFTCGSHFTCFDFFVGRFLREIFNLLALIFLLIWDRSWGFGWPDLLSFACSFWEGSGSRLCTTLWSLPLRIFLAFT
jgi:hypothetical protein